MFVRSSSYEALQFSEAQALKPVSAILVVAAALRRGVGGGVRLAGGGALGVCGSRRRQGVGERAAGI